MNCVILINHDARLVEVQGVVYCNGVYGTNEVLRNIIPQMLTRGTRHYTKSAFGKRLDKFGLQYSINTSSISPFFMEFDGRALSKFLPYLLGSIQESLHLPVFKEAELETEKGQYKVFIENREYDPQSRAANEGTRLLYAPGHPFYQSPEDLLLAQLEQLEAVDLQKTWGLIGVPENLRIVVVGDVDFSEVSQKVHNLFNWDHYSGITAMIDGNTFAEFEMDRGREERTIFIPDKANAAVWLGERVSITSTDERYPALRAANAILSSDSRLFGYVREELNLSYHVYSQLINMQRMPGYLEVVAWTNFKDVEKTQEAMFHVLDEFVSSGVTQEELDQTSTMMRGRLAVASSSYRGIAQQEVVSMISGAKDFQRTLGRKVAELTVDDVNEAIGEFIHPDEMKIVRAGTIE